MTYPAPKFLKDDPWFGPAHYSEKQRSLMQKQLYKEEMEQKCISYTVPGCETKYDTIHEAMYVMSTRNGKTTIKLDPIGGSENFQGGSENYHERNYSRSDH
jgi:hypothetical protein